MRVAIMPGTRVKGAGDLTQEETAQKLVSVFEHDLWREKFRSDAHMVTYRPIATGVREWPRYRKTIRKALISAGRPLVTQLLVLDYDNPGHIEWTPHALSQWLEHLADGPEILWQWSTVYTTLHGARIVYTLDTPVPVDQGEDHHRWLVQEFRKAGVHIDDIDALGKDSKGVTAANRYPTSDWTRLFRLPKVVRDGVNTWEQSYYMLETQPDNRLTVEGLGTLEKPKPTYSVERGQVVSTNYPLPNTDEAMSLLWGVSESTGNRVMSEFHKAVKRRLKNRPCFDCLFNAMPLADEGQRNNTLMTYTGQVVTLTYLLEDSEGERITTIEGIYALFLPVVEQLEQDPGERPWDSVLWHQVQYAWSRREAEETVKKEERAARRLDAAERLGEMAQGVRAWCESPEATGTDQQAVEFVVKHLIAVKDRTCYVLQDNGYYFPAGFSVANLHLGIKQAKMEELIEIEVETKNGGSRFVAPNDLVSRYGTAVHTIRGVPGAPGCSGAWLEGEDTSHASLVVPIYSRRTDLVPTYNPKVDQWLRTLYQDDYTIVANWIAHALDPHLGPICCHSLQGPAGVGKKLLIQGLAECFTHEMVMPDSELTDQYQPTMLKTPVMGVDEGWTVVARGGKHPADAFRELVAGGQRTLNRKYQPAVQVTNPLRIVLTANNGDVVKRLFGLRDMTPQDREAIALRIQHITVGSEAAIMLKKKGGVRHTQGWIKGDGGTPSEYIVAKHFLYLNLHEKRPAGKRLLVEGNYHSGMVYAMRTASGIAPFVAETLLRLIEASKGKRNKGLCWEKGKLYVLSSEVLTFFRDRLSKSCSEKLTASSIGHALAGMVTNKTEQLMLDQRKELGRRMWHSLDLPLMSRMAREQGWASSVLDGYLKEITTE